MDTEILKKRLSSFKNSKGIIRNVSDDLLVDVLRGWEQWPGTTKEYYQSLGLSKPQMGVLIGKAKRVRREGHYPEEEFKEVKVSEVPASFASLSSYGGVGIELSLPGGTVVRFMNVDQVLDFLKKSGMKDVCTQP